MKTKYIKITSILLFIFSLVSVFPVHLDATSGKLKSASICTASDGVKYGHHGDGHWHVAVKHDSGWYPQGGSLGYDNPCISKYQAPQEESIPEPEPTPEPEPEPQNIAPTLEFKTTQIEKYYSELPHTLTASTLISLFNATASDPEDGTLTHKIKVNTESIKIENINKTHTIIFEVSDEKNETTQQEVTLVIKSREKPIMEVSQNLEFYKKPSCEDLLNNNIFRISDADQQNIPLACSDLTIDEKNNTIRIDVKDAYNAANSQTFTYNIMKDTKSSSTISSIFTTLLTFNFLLLFVYLIMKLVIYKRLDISDLGYVFGLFGIKKFMERKYIFGVIYLLTFGIFSIGTLVDLAKEIYNFIFLSNYNVQN